MAAYCCIWLLLTDSKWSCGDDKMEPLWHFSVTHLFPFVPLLASSGWMSPMSMTFKLCVTWNQCPVGNSWQLSYRVYRGLKLYSFGVRLDLTMNLGCKSTQCICTNIYMQYGCLLNISVATFQWCFQLCKLHWWNWYWFIIYVIRK